MERKKATETSTGRYEMIAPLLADGLCAAELRRHRQEIMERYQISERTIRKYVERYRKNGLKGLEPKPKAVAGKFLAIPAEILELAKQYKEELPERSVRSIITILEKEGHVKKGSIARSTLTHNLASMGHSTKQLRAVRGATAARRFVRLGRNTLWQSDVKVGPYIADENGKKRRTYLATFIDDATRVVTHSEFYINHRVPILEDCLRKAMLKFGKPDSVYVDNGKEYVSRWMRIGCARLGIRHITAKPYSPQSKGKIERFNGYVNEFMQEIALAKVTGLAHLNQLYRAWLEEAYQHKEHSGLSGRSPMEAFQRDAKKVTFVSPPECYDSFLHEETRMVDKTGCFSLHNVIYEAGISFIRKKVDVRFDPFDLSVAELWYGGAKQRDVKPIAVGEFTNTSSPKTVATEIGRSRLLDAYVKENEKRKKYSMGVLNFDSQEGNSDV